MAPSFHLVIRRRGGQTDKRAFPTLAEAVDDIETELRAAATLAAGDPRVERALGRDYEPAQQVAVRGEVRGPRRLRAGIDVRGDGSSEAWTGVVRRRLIAMRDHDDAWSALRRELGLDSR